MRRRLHNPRIDNDYRERILWFHGAMSDQTTAEPDVDAAEPLPPVGQAGLLAAALLGVVLAQATFGIVPDSPAIQTWTAMFIGIVLQSFPFLVLGVLLATGISLVLSERVVQRVMPRHPALAVPVATTAGIGLVGCECASVPIAGGVMRKGVGAPAALAFLLAAPAVNPIVFVSTLVAFPALPEMAFLRFAGSFLVSVFVGWLWIRIGRNITLGGLADPHAGHDHGSGWSAFLNGVHRDLITTSGYLIIGAMIAASVNSFVPKSVLNGIGSDPVLGVLTLAALAFVVALCSQTDAFVAASLTAFTPTAQLVFLVVGPAMDVKLASLEAGAFGRRFAIRFVPLVLLVAIVVASILGVIFL